MSIEIVIEIPEDLYEGIERRDGSLETEYVCDELMKAVDNGTPLPKGHGDLIDRSELLMEVREIDCDAAPGGYEYILDKQYVLDAPTIIEADEEEGI